ncbi:MAG TPA: efflux RND transporter periplasmic adaptor subunit [Bryobacteraceae bacterium]|nr:efflux RND transporter periplasmic adaptor subunit [Bryobacteraceae bacterium]
MVRTLKLVLALVIALLIVGFVVVRGINSRIKAAAIVRQETMDLSIPTVAAIHPKRGALRDEIILPGNIQAFVNSPIYARTNGYLKKWYSDIGTRVKTGDLLAEIESPEVDQQLSQAKADLGTAQANMKLAELTMNRYQALLKLDAIARQDVDNAAGAYEADKAMVASQAANVKRLEQLVAFEKVYAPFDGVITVRNTDVGALINSGNGGAAQELFHIATTNKLRIFISVPQMYSHAAVPGVFADVTLTEMPGRHFPGKVARNAEAIDTATRTMLTEVDVDNPSGTLKPGAYAEVHLKLPAATPALIVPVTALIFRAEGLQLAVVRDGGKVELVQVTQGRDYGTEVEVTSGIREQDAVLVNPPDSITSGATVRVETAQ